MNSSTTEILPGKLFVGNLFSSTAPRNRAICNGEIKSIISLGNASAVYPTFDDVKYLRITIADFEGENIEKYFEDCIKFIDSAQTPVLVHCHAGVSRSPTIVAAYLMRKFSIGAAQALDFVKQRRPMVDINKGFYEQLLRFK